MRLILWQRYKNKETGKIETIEEIHGNKVTTDHRCVDIRYFKDNYEIRDEESIAGGNG